MVEVKGNSGLCVMKWIDDERKTRPVIELTDEFFANYVSQIQGRDYARVGGLVKIARDAGYAPIETRVVKLPGPDDDTVIFEARVFDPYTGQWWAAHGDANPKNVSTSKLAPHYIRIAETRAIGRVLRFAMGIDMVTVEELSGEEDWGPVDKPNSNLPPIQPRRQVQSTVAPAPAPAANTAEQMASKETLEEMRRLVEEENLVTWYQIRDYAVQNFGKAKRSELTEAQARQVIEWIKSHQKKSA